MSSSQQNDGKLVIGRTITHYRIVGQLGAGGMGIVYRAEDDRLGRAVALKLLPEELAHDPQAIDRLRAEARAASSLNHANICAIYDIGEDQGRPFIVMELLKGQSLRERLSAAPLRMHQLVELGIQIADALDAAHGEGIIHRDIKPANIFITDRQQVKLLDFGVAKLAEGHASSGTTGTPDLTAPGATIGTIAYMSPEQAAGETLDGRSDLFSLGVVLYEAATGHAPFTGKTSAVILSAILNRAPASPMTLNPEVPQHLQEIINNCLEKDREMRYQSAADLRADLKRLRREIESGQTHAVDSGSRSGVEASRRPRSEGSSMHAAASAPVAAAQRSRSLIVTLTAIAATMALGGFAIWQQGQRAPSDTGAPSAISDADLQSRIDQAAADLASRLAEQAKQKEAEARAAEPPRPEPSRPAVPAPAPRSSPARVVPAPPGANANQLTPPRTEPPAAAAAPPPQPAPPEQTPPVAAPPPATSTVPAAAAPAPAAAPPVSPPVTTAPSPPASAPAQPAPDARREAAVADEAIRNVIASYARAIEDKDIRLFRSLKPNLSREEQRRLEDGFRAVQKQSVNVTILSIDRRGDDAVVMLRRRDTVQAGGRQQQTESQQTIALRRGGGAWTIVEIK
jgi:serine/threonine protein kinase